MEERSAIAVTFNVNRTEVLLIKRKDVPVWTLPGGKIEENETPEQAIIRETLEETGYQTNIVRMVGLYHPINRLTRKTYLFEMHITSGEAQITNETKDIQFFALNNLPLNRMPPPYHEWILDANKNSKVILEKKLVSTSYAKCIQYLITNPILCTRFILARIGFPINR